MSRQYLIKDQRIDKLPTDLRELAKFINTELSKIPLACLDTAVFDIDIDDDGYGSHYSLFSIYYKEKQT